jgi:DNA polymerase I-like protein with 3'-5' exonuclease and polymerase domains
MLLKVDAAQLEWRVKVFLAQDPVGMEEIQKSFPIHDNNKEVFGLPTKTIAKNFLYRMIFTDAFGDNGFDGPAYAYAHDADFAHVSTSQRFWRGVVEKFFEKYQGVHKHSIALIEEATSTGKIVSPSGAFYLFKPVVTWGGQTDWPRTQILNYIVQGLSAQFVMIARLLLKKRLPELGYSDRALLINTVHDDIETDVDNDPELVYNISMLMEKCFSDIPAEFEKKFGVKVNVPMAGEVKMGWTLYEKEMVKFNKETFQEDWRKLNE